MVDDTNIWRATAADGRRVLAFYLPQFHPCAENDHFWGPGFSEWTQIASASSLWRGHEQPLIPGELGFYDLRLRETRQAQGELAAGHGIDGFVYYHYWFRGRRPFSAVLDDIFAGGPPDRPFALCWANENWTRAWDGGNREVLLDQAYDPGDDVEHARFLAPVLADSRYLRVDGRPLLLVHRAGLFPDPLVTTDRIRTELVRLGAGNPYLVRVESFPDESGDPVPLGFDAATEFAPEWHSLRGGRRSNRFLRALVRAKAAPRGLGAHRVAYGPTARAMRERAEPPYLRFPCVAPGWDNTPRRATGGLVLDGASPQAYAAWLGDALGRRPGARAGEDLVFVNAWNEWAEGAVLEPTRRHGRSYLEATATARAAHARASIGRR